MSIGVLIFLTVAILLLPQVFRHAARRARARDPRLLQDHRVHLLVLLRHLASLADRPSRAAPGAWPRDLDLQPHLRHRSRTASSRERPHTRLHGRPRILRIPAAQSLVPARQLHSGQQGRPRFRRHPRGASALKEGRVLPIFPEGHIVPESGRRIDEMKPGTAYLALHSGVPVIPAYLCGTPETDTSSSLSSHRRAHVSSSEGPSTSPTSRPTARPTRPPRPR